MAALRRPAVFIGDYTVVVIRAAAAVALVIGTFALALARMFGGLMMADHASGSRPEQPMMTEKVACDAADDRTFYAPPGSRRARLQRLPSLTVSCAKPAPSISAPL